MANFWSTEEIQIIIRDYLDMLRQELSGEAYNKADHNRMLQNLLNNRSKSSIEFKHQNITAIMYELGYPGINGYKPARNYQKELKATLEKELNNIYPLIKSDAEKFIQLQGKDIADINWSKVLSDAPEIIVNASKLNVREFTPLHYNFSELESKNRQLGASGEEFVLQFEKNRLASCGRSDLAKEIEWTSKIKGDGAGYDIRSFNPLTDQELFLEVKTTNSGKYQPFYISNNEVHFSEMNRKNFALYRVFNFNKDPKLFTIQGAISANLQLEVETYKAIFT